MIKYKYSSGEYGECLPFIKNLEEIEYSYKKSVCKLVFKSSNKIVFEDLAEDLAGELLEYWDDSIAEPEEFPDWLK